MCPAAGTVEEKILQLQAWKQQLIDGVMAGSQQQPLGKVDALSREELAFLLDRSSAAASDVLGRPDLLASAA
jgi:SNF2 family DNA or RNA helicase